jgi:hypothetical protein
MERELKAFLASSCQQIEANLSVSGLKSADSTASWHFASSYFAAGGSNLNSTPEKAEPKSSHPQRIAPEIDPLPLKQKHPARVRVLFLLLGLACLGMHAILAIYGQYV